MEERVKALEEGMKHLFTRMENVESLLNYVIKHFEASQQKPPQIPDDKAIVDFMERNGCSWDEAKQILMEIDYNASLKEGV